MMLYIPMLLVKVVFCNCQVEIPFFLSRAIGIFRLSVEHKTYVGPGTGWNSKTVFSKRNHIVKL